MHISLILRSQRNVNMSIVNNNYRLLDVLLYNTGYIWTSTQLKSQIGQAVRRVQYDFSSCVRVQIYPVLYSKKYNNLFILNLINEA